MYMYLDFLSEKDNLLFTDQYISGLYMCILQGTTVVKPVIYGNVARYFGKKREEDGHTHQWTVYIKPYKNEVHVV